MTGQILMGEDSYARFKLQLKLQGAIAWERYMRSMGWHEAASRFNANTCQIERQLEEIDRAAAVRAAVEWILR